MFKKRTPHAVTDLLPWYLNRSLPTAEQSAVEEQLRRVPQTLNAWQAIRSAALSQHTRVPPAALRQQILAQIRTTSRLRHLPGWLPVLSGVACALAALLLLWNIVQPGIGLQWSVNGVVPTAFRVYRAPVGSDRFEIVREVPAQSGILDYTYVDTTLWPGQAYQYRVEAVNVETASATIAANGADVLPTQLAIILSSLLIGVAGAYTLHGLALPHRRVYLKTV